MARTIYKMHFLFVNVHRHRGHHPFFTPREHARSFLAFIVNVCLTCLKLVRAQTRSMLSFMKPRPDKGFLLTRKTSDNLITTRSLTRRACPAPVSPSTQSHWKLLSPLRSCLGDILFLTISPTTPFSRSFVGFPLGLNSV